MVQYNLFTGKQTWRDRKPDGKKPKDGFVVLKVTNRPPPLRRMPMGAFDVNVLVDGLNFDRATKLRDDSLRDRSLRDSRFRARSGRP